MHCLSRTLHRVPLAWKDCGASCVAGGPALCLPGACPRSLARHKRYGYLVLLLRFTLQAPMKLCRKCVCFQYTPIRSAHLLRFCFRVLNKCHTKSTDRRQQHARHGQNTTNQSQVHPSRPRVFWAAALAFVSFRHAHTSTQPATTTTPDPTCPTGVLPPRGLLDFLVSRGIGSHFVAIPSLLGYKVKITPAETCSDGEHNWRLDNDKMRFLSSPISRSY